MKVKFKNIGKYKEANVELNGITVIAGENNTGKSTIGKLLYCLYTAFYKIDEKSISQKKSFLKSLIMSYVSGLQFRKTILGSVTDIIKISSEENIAFNDIYVNSVDDAIKANYEVEENKHMNFLDGLKNVISFDEESFASLVLNLYLVAEYNNQVANVNGGKPNVEIIDKNDSFKIENNEGVFIFKKILNSNGPVIYIDNPYIVDSKPNDDDVSKYSHQSVLRNLFLTDNINDNVFMNDYYNKKFSRVLNKIEQAVCGNFINDDGTLKFQEDGFNSAFFLKNLSTGLKTFVILKRLFENHQLAENSIVVLDEPEIHLHPQWQLLLAEIIVIVQKEFNLKVLITTHSPYFLNAIEVYAARYSIADTCKYYLTYLDKDGVTANIKDVTGNTNEIYALLANPMQVLSNLEYEMRKSQEKD